MQEQSNKGSLVVVGTGIKSLSHLTVEARANIEQADVVLYLVNEPAMKEWLVRANPNSKSLDDLYFKYDQRIDAYHAITAHILAEVEMGKHVCVALYGHPTVYAKPALDAADLACKRGITATILPAVSAEDCLFADLKVDPGTSGCLSYEATDLLIYRRHIDPACHLLVWQISAIGAQGHIDGHDNKNGIEALVRYLLMFYKPDHRVVVYVAALYPGFMPAMDEVAISELAARAIPTVATLYVPPAAKSKPDMDMIRILGLEKNNKNEGG